MMTPRYSRSYINRIGEILADDNSTDDELESASQTLNDWRALHLYPMNTFQATLRKYVGEIDPKGIVAQRLKRHPTIVDKLKNRQKTMNLGRMHDVGGLRAIVNSVPKVRAIEKKFKHYRAKHLLKKTYDYITEPKESGYRGIHLVYEYHNPKKPDCDGLLIEIQLRTRLQHLWSTAVETAGFFFQESLKSSQGNERRLEFFQQVSALFALEEGQPTSPQFRHFTRETLIDKLRQFEEQYGILPQLEAIQIASRVKSEQKLADAAYWIIKTNLDPPSMEIIPFVKRQQSSANLLYGFLERKTGKGQVVLVSTDSVKKLEKAYPNFFLDIRDFIAKVKMLFHRKRG
jgi:ppGpp synthetase/RelA/SpoT-type nucleotidyltranferase